MNNRIETNQKVMLGKPLIKGTRITVGLILRQLAQGLTVKDILTNYPHLKAEDIQAAVAYAAELVEEESAYPLVTPIHGKTKVTA